MIEAHEAQLIGAIGATPLKNERWERFAVCRAEGKSLSEAHIDAGFKKNTKKIMSASAAKLQSKAVVRARIDYLKYRITEAVMSSREQVIRELERIAFVDPRTIVQWDERGVPSITASKELTDDQAAAVASVRLDKGKSLEVKLYDKLAALDKLAKVHGAYPQQTDGTPPVTVIVVAPPKLTTEEWMRRYSEGIPATGYEEVE